MGEEQSRGRPVVFTDEVLQKIPHWVALGADTQEIAEVLGTTRDSLMMTCSRHGISLRRAAYTNGAVDDAVLRRGLRSDHWVRLREEARRRGVPVAQIVVDLITAVAQDDLFRAVLDDADDEDLQ